MSAKLSFINISSNADEDKYEHSYSLLAPHTQGGETLALLRLVPPLIICGLVLSIIGGIDRMPDNSRIIIAYKYDRDATLTKVSGALFLIASATGYVTVYKGTIDSTSVLLESRQDCYHSHVC